MKIRGCERNKGADQLMLRLQAQFSGHDIKLKKCAKQCKICRQQSFVLVDKKLFKNSDPGLLYNDLVGLLES
jgi:uncharacterized protein YuzB (UPF0349 family)